MSLTHVLNLGAGVQSTALYLLSMRGEEGVPKFDYAVFADTQEEPDSVYEHLERLEGLDGPPIVRVTNGSLGSAISAGTDYRGVGRTDGRHYISIPAYTVDPVTLKAGVIRRQCTGDYKVKPVERWIRETLGAKPGRPLEKTKEVVQYMGLSFDEPKRVIRVKSRFDAKPSNWHVRFPLWEMEWERQDCQSYCEEVLGNKVPRSACVFCPFKTDKEWKDLKENDTKGWERAVEVDSMCRVGSGKDSMRYVHKSCVPLSEVDLRSKDEKSGQMMFQNMRGFQDECEGYCGN